MTVDTLSLAKDLRSAELSSTQAKAIAAAIGRSVTEGTVTKADLLASESRLEAKIEQLRSTLLTWFVATILTIGAIVIAALKL